MVEFKTGDLVGFSQEAHDLFPHADLYLGCPPHVIHEVQNDEGGKTMIRLKTLSGKFFVYLASDLIPWDNRPKDTRSSWEYFCDKMGGV